MLIIMGGIGYNLVSMDEVVYVFFDNFNDLDGWLVFNEFLFFSDWWLIGFIFIEYWEVGQVIEFDVVYFYFCVDGVNFLENVNEMYEGIFVLQVFYDDNFVGSCVCLLICDEDCVWLGDLNVDGIVNYEDMIVFGFGFELSGSL